MTIGNERRTKTTADRPSGWLRNLARLNPRAPWPWRHSIRMAIAVAVPLLVGHFSGYREPALLVCLGAFLNSIKVQSDPYRARLAKLAIAAPIAGLGYVLGTAAAGHGALSILLLMAVAFGSGIISGYGAALSTAAMQMLVLAIIGASEHSGAPLWLPPLLFMAGAAFAAALIGCEALIDRRHPERVAIAHVIGAMIHLANVKAQTPTTQKRSDTSTPVEIARRSLTDVIAKGFAGLLNVRRGNEGQSAAEERKAALLSTIELMSAEIVGSRSPPAVLRAIAERLERIQHALVGRQGRPSLAGETPAHDVLFNFADRLADEIWPASAESSAQAGPGKIYRPAHDLTRWLTIRSYQALLGRLTLGREVVLAALQLSLCIGIALVVQHTAPGDRSYWIPLTVAIVLKPDFGSVFVRAVQRSIGTVAGVVIGVTLMALLPKGLILIAILIALAAAIPWAGLRGYALQCTILTPFVLLLIDVSVVGPTVDYAIERLVDTIMGAAIALVFGYLIWPRSPQGHFRKSFAAALQAVAAYLDMAGKVTTAGYEAMLPARRRAYHSLSNVRTSLQRALSEPPPASSEAAAWYPLIVNAERLCDHITYFAELQRERTRTPIKQEIAARVALLQDMAVFVAAENHMPNLPAGLLSSRADETSAIVDIDFEISRLLHLLEAVQPGRRKRIRSRRALRPDSAGQGA
ncbi:FUSC family protein [Chelatococcus asaccharovorans]|uniref:Putative membrane protein YccC n=1 Tax=Chelatococcus asaccharovorans TaxID=28210 RepID=A0A2V3UD82_9HYPH|nr:FUSC family protein [Chelatococcus asaccharovorans]MBS7703588.1 FUSC family protein [Chelatococcus asaccharovorans]PXW61932.1 putative membrane protein YccC [Chelatococcus asaccharovorans]